MRQIRMTALRAAGVLLVVAGVGAGRTVTAQTAAARYQQMVAREQAARAVPAPAPAALRAIAASYENITRQHPTSGYADNALWQASGVLEFVFLHGGSSADRDHAVRLLNWLTKEYPSSSLLGQAHTRLAELAAVAPSSVPASKTAAAPAPTPGPAVPKPQRVPMSSDPPMAAPVVPALSDVALAQVAEPVPARTEPATVSAISRTALATGDRITLELDREASYSSRRDATPDRILCDMANTTISAAATDQIVRVTGSLVKSLQTVVMPDGTARLTLALSGRARYSTFPLYHPFRLVIDVESEPMPVADAMPPAPVPIPTAVSRAPVTTIAAKPAPAPPTLTSADRPKSANGLSRVAPPVAATPGSTAKGDYSLSRQLGLGVSRIVIDPGHGGRDPGAMGNGVTEAELVLDVAMRLRKLLQAQPGVEVVLTRQADEFIPLEQRTATANRESADLFLSIHANAGGETAHGVETYFLNLATTPHAEAVAARENASSTQTMGVLPEILKAITLNNKLAESREFATMVQASLVRRLAVQNKTMRDLGVKQAPFQVLVGARMPSVLAEIAFVTNQGEASLVKESAYRQRIAQALCDAVLRYQSSLKKAATTVAEGEEE